MPKKFTSSGRDAWTGTGAGKGDAPRYKHDENYRANYEAIIWSPRIKGKFHKRYGPASGKFSELAAESAVFTGRKDR